MAASASSVYVKVDKSMQIVDGISSTTSAAEVIQRLSNKFRRSKPQVLLEVWNGCSRMFQPQEILLESLNKWGNHTRTITLVMMDRDKYSNGPTLKGRGRTRRRNRCRVLCTFKLSYKRLPLRSTPKLKHLLKQELLSKLKRDIQLYRQEKGYLTNRLQENSAQESSVRELLSKLSPALQSRYTSLSNDVTKLTQCNKELLKHKIELKQTLTNRRQEIQSLQQTIETLQQQIKSKNSQTELLEDAADLVSRHSDLLTSLRAKQKISQLQSIKLQELMSTKSIIERQLQDCIEEIQNIKIEV